MAVDQTLAQVSNTMMATSMAVYAGAMVAYAIDLGGRGSRSVEVRGEGSAGLAQEMPVRRRAAGIAVALTWLAFLVHLAGVVFRGVATQRVPVANMYEFAVSGAAAVTGAFLLMMLRRDLRVLGIFVTGTVLLTLGLALVVLYTDASELVPALRSYWLGIHVPVAVVASCLLALSFVPAVLQLFIDHRADKPMNSGLGQRIMNKMPSASSLERLTARLIIVAFPLWTFTLVAGAIWAQKAWGRYWGWDPKEVWTFVIWVVYAAYLHARVTRGWSRRRTAWLAVAGFICVLLNFSVVNVFMGGNHSYAGIG